MLLLRRICDRQLRFVTRVLKGAASISDAMTSDATNYVCCVFMGAALIALSCGIPVC